MPVILALDGGGIRGIFQSCIIEQLHDSMRLLDYVDIMCGTSTGGLIAVALSLDPSKIHSMHQAYVDLGKKVFSRKRDYVRSMIPFIPRYSSRNLQKQIEIFLGDENILFGSVQTPCLLTAIGAANNSLTLFDSSLESDRKYMVVDLLMATTAAPTYFTPASVNNNQYVDGGLVCNNPSMHVVCNLIQNHNYSVDDIKVISIGCCGVPTQSSIPKSFSGVRASWARSVVGIGMTFTSEVPSFYCKHLLGSNYLRIDRPQNWVENISLDGYKDAVEKLPPLAESVIRESNLIKQVKELIFNP